MRNLDKYFRDGLKDAKTEYSSDLWSKIESSLDEGQRKTRPFWFQLSSILGILLVLGIAGYLLAKSNSESNNGKTNNPEIIASSGLSNTQLDQVSMNSFENIKNSNSLSESKTTNTESTDSKISKENSTAVIKKESNNQSTNLNTELVNDLQAVDFDLNESFELVSASMKSEELFTETEIEKTDVLNSSLFLEELTDIRTLSLNNFIYSSDDFSYPASFTDVECGENEDLSKQGFGIDIYISPDLAFRDLNSMGDGETQYLIERERTENQSLSFSAGARISYSLKSGLTLRTGINYSQINETFNYTETRTQTTIIRDEEGNIISIEEEQIEVDKKSSNSFKSVDIPILLGLEMPVNDRFSLSMNTGLFLNAAFSSRGKILSPEFEPVFITEGSGDLEVYKSGLGVSYYGSIGLHHEISPGLEILVEPNMRYYSQSFTTSDYPLTQDYIKFGLLSGIKFRF